MKGSSIPAELAETGFEGIRCEESGSEGTLRDSVVEIRCEGDACLWSSAPFSSLENGRADAVQDRR